MSDDLIERLSVDFRMMRTYDDPTGPFVRYQDHAQALTEARAEIERLRAKPPLLDAQSLPGVDALVKTLEAQLDEALRSCLAEREGRLKAEAAISTLRARVREVVGPFGKIDPFEAAFSKHGKIFRLDYNASLLDQLTFEHFRSARQLNEDLK